MGVFNIAEEGGEIFSDLVTDIATYTELTNFAISYVLLLGCYCMRYPVSSRTLWHVIIPQLPVSPVC
jgi:hypothetical protein